LLFVPRYTGATLIKLNIPVTMTINNPQRAFKSNIFAKTLGIKKVKNKNLF